MTATGHLIGRDAELAALAACLDRAAAGQGQVVFLTGDAGIGKSALAQEFLRRAEAAGHRTLTGHAYLAEGQAPYAVVVDAVRDGLRRYRRNDRSGMTVPFGPPAGGVIDGRDDKVWLFESGYEFFGGLVPPKAALIVFLGDLQWADTAALEFVHYLGRNLQSDRILLLVSYRREDLNRRPALAQTLGSLRRQGHTTEITLRPLSPAEAAGLARVLPGLPAEPPPDLVEELHERARGNPLYFIELIRATAETGVPPGPAGGSSAPLPQLIQDVVQSRLEGLTPVSRDSLVVAAAIGLVVP
ncbi:MAG TPA: AAA family ATPase, partial [Dehalococcoidia bacterium]|nr:AAA family ATPase [Dehalococcoidia bacterium]